MRLKERNRKMEKKGISLIVLVITIIIMIILASAVILSLNSSNIVEKTKEAKEDNNEATVREQAILKLAEFELAKADGTVAKTAKAFIEEEFTIENGYDSDYYANNKGVIVGTKHVEGAENNKKIVPIPLGFTESTAETEDEISEGLVVIDSQGNEFVWIPVNYINFGIKYWYQDTWGYEPLNENSPYLNSTTVLQHASEIEQYNAMKQSVKEHGGFYIARYEAGLPSNKTYQTVTKNGTDIPVSKKGATVWNNIGFDSTWAEQNGAPYGLDTNEGCALVAKKAYSNSSSVVSHLPYGIEYDAIYTFIQSQPSSKDPTISNTWGNQSNSSGDAQVNSGSLQTCGKNDAWQAKNIYDIAGNVFECTYEATDSFGYSGRYSRSGAYNSSYYAAARGTGKPNRSADHIGFRISLYIK